MLECKTRSRRRGVTVPFVAVLLIGLLGVAAVAIDGGLLLAARRKVQAAADAAALAAAIDLFQNYDSNQGKDVNNEAANSAIDTAKDNGYASSINNATVTVNIPPASGAYAGTPGYAEVIITVPEPRFFSSIFSRNTVTVAGRAVARGSKVPKGNGLIVLSPSGSNQLTTTATGTVNVMGADVIVDSNNTAGATITNIGNITANAFYLSGIPGYATSSSGQFIGTIYSNQTPTPDPLANLPPPAQPSVTYSNVNISNLPTTGGNVPGYPTPGNPNGWTLPPGTYQNGIHISDNNSAHTYTLASGVFYFTGGGLTLSSNAAIQSDPNGTLLYFHNNGGLSITAGGPVSLTPLSTGPYANIAIYQDRSNTSQNSITGQSTGSLNLSGTVYLPAAKLTLTGSGGNYALGSQYIVYQLSVTGSGTFNVTYNAPQIPPDRNLYLVE